jgi:hypothetical protein
VARGHTSASTRKQRTAIPRRASVHGRSVRHRRRPKAELRTVGRTPPR